MSQVQGFFNGIPVAVFGAGGAPVDVNVVAGGGVGSPFGDPLPANGSAVGLEDSAGQLAAARVHDLDSGAGQEQNVGVSLREAAPGGSVATGTLINPLRVDPTGTTNQPADLHDGAGNPIGSVGDSLKVTVTAGGGGAFTVADGADVAEGSTSDAAIVSDSAGTVSGKLRGLVKIFADVWNSTAHALKVDGSGVTQPVSGPVTNAELRATSVSVSLDDVLGALKQILNALTRPIWLNMLTGKPVMEIAASQTVGTVTTVTTVTSMSQIGGVDAANFMPYVMRANWYQAYHGRIS